MIGLGVAIGGALGALARYWLDGLIASRRESPFPLGTLIINVSGSTALGVLVGEMTKGHLSATALSWAGTGFLGGYTTFSTFVYETVRLIEDGAGQYAARNLAFSGPVSFAGAALGFGLARL